MRKPITSSDEPNQEPKQEVEVKQQKDLKRGKQK